MSRSVDFNWFCDQLAGPEAIWDDRMFYEGPCELWQFGTVSVMICDHEVWDWDSRRRRYSSTSEPPVGIGLTATVSRVHRVSHSTGLPYQVVSGDFTWFEWSETAEIRAYLQELGVLPTLKTPTKRVRWEILPPGMRPTQQSGEVTSLGYQTERYERLEYLDSLRPIRWWRGVPLRGSREYWVAEFPRYVVADAPEDGNALFCIPSDADWHAAFSGTKAAARAAGAQRIIHGRNYRARLTKLLG